MVLGNFQNLSALRIRIVVGKRSALPAEDAGKVWLPGAGCIGFLFMFAVYFFLYIKPYALADILGKLRCRANPSVVKSKNIW